jgi:hypothetical protein
MREMTPADWASFAVAGATVLLAISTAVMARKTRRAAEATEEVAGETRTLAEEARNQVEAVREQSAASVRQAESSERQAELSVAAIEASIQPWLTRVTPPPYAQFGKVPLAAEETIVINEVGETIKISLYLRNVGAGLAVIQSGEELRDRFVVEGRDVDRKPVTRYGFAGAAAVPPGDTTRIGFMVQRVSREHFLSMDRNDGEFYVTVPYTDAKGGQLVDARIHVTRVKAQGVWAIHRIEYTNDGDDAPFATIEFDTATWS